MIVGIMAKEQTSGRPAIDEDYVWWDASSGVLQASLKDESIRIYNNLSGPTKYKITLKKG